MGFSSLWLPRHAHLAALLPALTTTAVASQGPGGGPGTASAAAQLAMAIAVYGGAGLILAAGLIGLLRRRFSKF